jgi:hypothetical protein
MTETNGRAIGARSGYSTRCNEPSRERLCREELLRASKDKALLAFLGFSVRRPGPAQHEERAARSDGATHE